jgi:hypothetical protein
MTTSFFFVVHHGLKSHGNETDRCRHSQGVLLFYHPIYYQTDVWVPNICRFKYSNWSGNTNRLNTQLQLFMLLSLEIYNVAESICMERHNVHGQISSIIKQRQQSDRASGQTEDDSGRGWDRDMKQTQTMNLTYLAELLPLGRFTASNQCQSGRELSDATVCIMVTLVLAKCSWKPFTIHCAPLSQN